MPDATWSVSGTYLESCNCDPICPCRTIGGVPGGRSTYGVCLGALSWWIEQGQADGLDLSRRAVALVYRYSDDEPGSPWTFTLHVDERAGEQEREALSAIFLGRRGSARIQGQPWVRKPSTVLEVVPSRIELDHVSERRWLRVGTQVVLRVSTPVETDSTVSCIVPGHDRLGTELHTEMLTVSDAAFEAEFTGRCAFTAPFAYSSQD
jgi:hypothetical protein